MRPCALCLSYSRYGQPPVCRWSADPPFLQVDLPPGSWAQHATAGFILLSVAELALLWSHADQDSSVPSTAAYVIHFTASCPPELQHLAAAYTLVNFRDCYAGLALETPFTLIDFDYTFDGSAVCGRLYFDEFLKPVYEWAVLRCQAFDGGEFTFHGDLPSCSWGLPIQEFAGGGYRTALENLLGLTRCA